MNEIYKLWNIKGKIALTLPLKELAAWLAISLVSFIFFESPSSQVNHSTLKIQFKFKTK